MEFKSGFFTIIGRPNVGKSTLLNMLTGQKVAIMSPKPQTTRNTIKTVVTKGDLQVIFIDTPGMHKPKNKLGDYMVNAAVETFNEVDGIFYLVDATDKQPGSGDMFIINQLKNIKTPVYLLINKIDLLEDKSMILPLIDSYKTLMEFKGIIPISALKEDTVAILMEEIKNTLPVGPMYFPEDMLTDQPEKLIVAELIREKLLHLLNDEVPHGIGVEVILFKERKQKNIIEIQANIYCERNSHKGIVIGKKGAMLKKIGTLAREEIEALLGTKVFLQLWVKVKDDWRNSQFMLNTLGYK